MSYLHYQKTDFYSCSCKKTIKFSVWKYRVIFSQQIEHFRSRFYVVCSRTKKLPQSVLCSWQRFYPIKIRSFVFPNLQHTPWTAPASVANPCVYIDITTCPDFGYRHMNMSDDGAFRVTKNRLLDHDCWGSSTSQTRLQSLLYFLKDASDLDFLFWKCCVMCPKFVALVGFLKGLKHIDADVCRPHYV